MKILISIFLSIFLFSGCSKVKKNNIKSGEENKKNEIENYGVKLIENDFLKYADQTKIDSLKLQIESSFNIYNQELNKFSFIDAEELAEFNFDFFLPELNKILEKRNVTLNVNKTSNFQSTNVVVINNEKVKLYDKADFKNHTFWDIAPKNFFKKVNEILKSKNLDEKFYLVYGGNDLAVFLLTEKQFEIIKMKYSKKSNEIPYLP